MLQSILSIIISTRNRAPLLKHCLDSLVTQSSSPAKFEIVVVDNHSTDHTRSVVKHLSHAHPRYRIYLHGEPRIGMSIARNTGADHSHGKYLAFIDDDAVASTHWVRQILATITKYHPQILGGPIYPLYRSPKPAWFQDSYEIRSHGPKPRPLNSREFLSGSNLVVDHQLYDALGQLDPHLGPIGSTRTVGEDAHLQHLARSRGATVYYHPDIIVNHLVPARKMTITYPYHAQFYAGYSHPQLPGKPVIVAKAFLALVNIFGLFLFGFIRNRKTYPFLANFHQQVISRHAFWLGAFWKVLNP